MMDVDPTEISLRAQSMDRIAGVTWHGNIEFDCPAISFIDHNLYQGGYVEGTPLPTEFKHLVSLYPWHKWKVGHRLQTELYFEMYDATDQSVDRVDAVARLINLCRVSAPVFVHCQAGLNRSSLVVARALWLGGMFDTGEDVIKHIREARSPACLCNPAFEDEVLSWGTGSE